MTDTVETRLKEILKEFGRGCSNTWETHNPADCEECLDAAIRVIVSTVKHARTNI